MKKITIALCLLIFTGCVKQKIERIYVPEKVSMDLISQYIEYEMAVQRKSLWGKPITNMPTRQQFDAFIDNFLANERNALIEGRITLKHTANRPDPNSPPDSYDGGGGGVSCTGRFSAYNTYNTILFTAQLDATRTSILTSTFDLGGVGATWTTIGTIEQTTVDGVITYKQYFKETYDLPGDFQVVQLYVLYGNIYNGGCTVQGMQLPIKN